MCTVQACTVGKGNVYLRPSSKGNVFSLSMSRIHLPMNGTINFTIGLINRREIDFSHENVKRMV